MKKAIIAAVLVLTSAVTAFSLTTKADNNAGAAKIKEDGVNLSVKTTSAPKADIATAD